LDNQEKSKLELLAEIKALKGANEILKNQKELAFQNREKEKRGNELILANKELAFQKNLEVYRSEMEHVALELTLLIDTANAPIFGIDADGKVNEWNQTSENITVFKKKEVLGKLLLNIHYQKIAVLK
jgi:PAS domain-containing protein